MYVRSHLGRVGDAVPQAGNAPATTADDAAFSTGLKRGLFLGMLIMWVPWGLMAIDADREIAKLERDLGR